MKRKVYIETSVISYLTARPSKTIIGAAHQQITQAWWEQRAEYELLVSQRNAPWAMPRLPAGGWLSLRG